MKFTERIAISQLKFDRKHTILKLIISQSKLNPKNWNLDPRIVVYVSLLELELESVNNFEKSISCSWLIFHTLVLLIHCFFRVANFFFIRDLQAKIFMLMYSSVLKNRLNTTPRSNDWRFENAKRRYKCVWEHILWLLKIDRLRRVFVFQ